MVDKAKKNTQIVNGCRRKFIVNVSFLFKGYGKNDIDLFLGIINPLPKSLESVYFQVSQFFLITR